MVLERETAKTATAFGLAIAKVCHILLGVILQRKQVRTFPWVSPLKK